MFEIPRNSLYTMTALIAILGMASIVLLALRVRNRGKNYSELRLRIRSWWCMIGLLFLFLVMGRKTSLVFFAFLSFLALKELLSIVPTRQEDRRVIFWAYLSIPVQYYWVYIGWYGMYIIFIPVYAFLFFPMRMVLIGETRGFIRAAGLIHWAVMLTVFCLSHIAYLLTLPIKNADAGAIGLILFLLIMTEFNDVCQYVSGKLLGRRRIIPKVSPNKTWEGFAGGLIIITLCGTLIGPLLTPLSWSFGLLAGLLIGISGFIGDIVISAVKRDLQIKNSGDLIPGHGGILDRLDSLFYTSPVFFHFIYYLYY